MHQTPYISNEKIYLQPNYMKKLGHTKRLHNNAYPFQHAINTKLQKMLSLKFFF
jgi:hypothetical protein